MVWKWIHCAQKLLMQSYVCYSDLQNKFAEALQKYRLKIGQDAAQAPHKHHQFTKYSQCIVCMHLLIQKFPGHWCNVRNHGLT